jgi:hypothetical protein
MDLATALNIATTTAVVGGVIFGAWQIRVATRARETQISLQLVEMLQTRDLIEGLRAAPRHLPSRTAFRCCHGKSMKRRPNLRHGNGDMRKFGAGTR